MDFGLTIFYLSTLFYISSTSAEIQHTIQAICIHSAGVPHKLCVSGQLLPP